MKIGEDKPKISQKQVKPVEKQVKANQNSSNKWIIGQKQVKEGENRRKQIKTGQKQIENGSNHVQVLRLLMGY